MSGAAAYLICGEALIDLIPLEGGGEHHFIATPGGSPFNVAIGLGRLGAETFFLGRLSSDPNGRRLSRCLAENGVRLDFVRTGNTPSTLACIFPPEPGQPDVRYAFYLQGTSGAALDPADMPDHLPEQIRAVHFGSFAAILPGSGSLIRDFAAASGRLVSYDPNIRPSLMRDRDIARPEVEACMAVADLVKLSDADAAWLYPGRSIVDIAAEILRSGPTIVAVTKGADGAEIFTATDRIAVKGVPVSIVDTVGAGDTFMATLLWGLGRRNILSRDAFGSMKSETLAAVAATACRAAAIVCTRVGADMPSAAELE
jgi:fructokinase